ncbi:MAG: hypothetical protein HDT40_02825 [Lachnospiraceae bacterium]|nr:hypothetical protein [Lachnospiraceae bacterium]
MKLRKIKYKIFISIILCAVVCFLGCFKALDIKAAEPKVMVADYKLNPTEVVSGEDFKITITLKNTASRKVRNMKLTVTSAEGEFIPVNGAGTAYISEMAAEEELEITFDMTAISGLQEKSYKLTIKSEYEDTNGYSYTVEDNIYIPITLEQRVSVTDIMSDSSVKLGDDIEITGRINNIGEGTLYNVTVEVEGENIDTQISYVGNIESGKSGNIDVLTHTIHPVEEGVYSKNHMIVTYEDKNKEKHSQKVDLYLSIEATNYSNLEILKEPEEKEISSETIIIIAVVAVVLVVIILSVMKWRKKKKILEEF